MLQGEKHNLDTPRLQACVKAQDEKTVRESLHEGTRLEWKQTPAMFINGQELDGAVPADEVRLALDQH